MKILNRIFRSVMAVSAIGLIGCSSHTPFVGEAIYGTKSVAPENYTYNSANSMAMNLFDAAGFRAYLDGFSDADLTIYSTDQTRQMGNTLAAYDGFTNGFSGMGVAGLLLSAPEWRHYNYDWVVTFIPMDQELSLEEKNRKSETMYKAIELHNETANTWAKAAYANYRNDIDPYTKQLTNYKVHGFHSGEKNEFGYGTGWPSPARESRVWLYKGQHAGVVRCPVFLDVRLSEKKCLVMYSKIGEAKSYRDKAISEARGVKAGEIYTKVLAPYLPDNSFIWVAGSKHRQSPPYILTNKGRQDFVKPQ